MERNSEINRLYAVLFPIFCGLSMCFFSIYQDQPCWKMRQIEPLQHFSVLFCVTTQELAVSQLVAH